jgi:hypothetical protein
LQFNDVFSNCKNAEYPVIHAFLAKVYSEATSKFEKKFDIAAFTLANDFLYKNVTLAVPALTTLGDITQIGPHCPR